VIDLASLDTDGPDGAVWSLPAGSDLNANLVKLSPGGHIDCHRNAEVDVVIVVVDGAGDLIVDDETHALRPHILAHIPKGAERELNAGPTGLVYLSLHRARGGLQIRPRQPV
jgi:quercetin dioxygenase-like cupin family protein